MHGRGKRAQSPDSLARLINVVTTVFRHCLILYIAVEIGKIHILSRICPKLCWGGVTAETHLEASGFMFYESWYFVRYMSLICDLYSTIWSGTCTLTAWNYGTQTGSALKGTNMLNKFMQFKCGSAVEPNYILIQCLILFLKLIVLLYYLEYLKACLISRQIVVVSQHAIH